MMIKKWQKIKSEIVFNHKWFKLRQDTVMLPDGKIIDDYIVSERPDVVLIFPITSENNVIMVEQYKHAAEEIMLEFPGGFFNSEEESPQAAAQRELLEETEDIAVNIISLDAIEAKIFYHEIKATLSVALGLMALRTIELKNL